MPMLALRLRRFWDEGFGFGTSKVAERMRVPMTYRLKKPRRGADCRVVFRV